VSSATSLPAPIEHARDQHAEWSKVGLAERRERVTAAIDSMVLHRDLLALLLVWEIGKPWRLAVADVDRWPGRGPLVRRRDRAPAGDRN
jgi:acyl-CoA reductase-like NAD-dependent aldehyde dehydrogenase